MLESELPQQNSVVRFKDGRKSMHLILWFPVRCAEVTTHIIKFKFV